MIYRIDKLVSKVCNQPISETKIKLPLSLSKSKSGRLEKDKIVVSAYGAEVNRFKEMIKSIPDVRVEKIEMLKKLVESGKYNVPAEAVVEGLSSENIW